MAHWLPFRLRMGRTAALTLDRIPPSRITASARFALLLAASARWATKRSQIIRVECALLFGDLPVIGVFQLSDKFMRSLVNAYIRESLSANSGSPLRKTRISRYGDPVHLPHAQGCKPRASGMDSIWNRGQR